MIPLMAVFRAVALLYYVNLTLLTQPTVPSVAQGAPFFPFEHLPPKMSVHASGYED